MRNAEKAGPETRDTDGVDESSGGSSNYSSEIGDLEEDEDADFSAWW